jgi:preprotein translocase subunit YajC
MGSAIALSGGWLKRPSRFEPIRKSDHAIGALVRPTLWLCAHCKRRVEPLASADLEQGARNGGPQNKFGDEMPPGGPQDLLVQFAPIILLVVLFYFMLIRPQQKRAKEHANMLANLKRNDSVVLSSGVLGKIVRVEDKEVGVEIAQGVTVKVIKGMITEVRAKGDPAPANDAKA